MNDKLHIPDDQIIAFVCGAMSREERAKLAAQMIDDAELAARVDTVRRVLAPLDAWRADEPAAGAVDAIMQRVAQTTPLSYVAQTARLSPVAAGPAERRSRFTLAQFFAVAASIALLLSVLFPTIQRRNDSRLQTACLGNMLKLAEGLQGYATEFDGALPRVGFSQPVNWLNHPQRQQFTPAIRLMFIAPRNVFCPSGSGAGDDEAARRDLAAFFDRADLRFYTIQHPASGPGRLGAQVDPMLIAGDENPLFPNGGSVRGLDDNQNSIAHRRHGQNVLFAGGSAEFLRSPRLPNADNIWRAEGVVDYQGTETPVSATDSFLIP